jgi:hypothetical protein
LNLGYISGIKIKTSCFILYSAQFALNLQKMRESAFSTYIINPKPIYDKLFYEDYSCTIDGISVQCGNSGKAPQATISERP